MRRNLLSGLVFARIVIGSLGGYCRFAANHIYVRHMCRPILKVYVLAHDGVRFLFGLFLPNQGCDFNS